MKRITEAWLIKAREDDHVYATVFSMLTATRQ